MELGNVKVVLYGVGAVGSLIGRHLSRIEGLRIVGAIDSAKEKVGKELGAVLGLPRSIDVVVSDDADAVLANAKPDIVVHATSSYLKDVFPQLEQIVNHGVNVVSTCEELSYPYCSEPELADKLDELAKENHATVLGTGINPGFLMDTLVITLTTVCQSVESIKAVRVMNAATRRVPFQKKIGAGLSVEEFQKAIKSGRITGHVGLEQSACMIAAALGWELDKVTIDPVEPVVAKKPVKSKAVTVERGRAAGLRQMARGYLNDKDAITLEFQAYIGAKEEYDSITIKGVPNVNQKVSPCVHGDIGTVAMVTNALPKVINAPPGLVTMKDLPVPSAALGNLANFVKSKRTPR